MGLFDIFRRKKEEAPAEAAENEAVSLPEEPTDGEAEAAQDAAEEPEEALPEEEPAEAVEEDVTPSDMPAEEAGPAPDASEIKGAPFTFPEQAGGMKKLSPEEIQERREKAKAQQEEMEAKGKLLSYMIDQYHEQRTPKALEAAIRCLGDTVVVVPMQMVLEKSDAEAMALARQQGRQYKPVKPVRLVPAFLNTPKGGLHYPVFASRADIPKDQVKKFIWANIPATRCSLDVIRNEKLAALVVNPFGKSLVLKRELLQKIVKVQPAGGNAETPSVEGEGGYTS